MNEDQKKLTFSEVTLTNLDKYVQLHERIEILYIVTGYQVQYYTKDGNILKYEVEGETIFQALQLLESILVSKNANHTS